MDNPSDLVRQGDRFVGTVNPTMVWVDSVTLPPDELPLSTFPWFVGQVKPSAVLPSIVGMSGGPIFGFKKNAAGQMEYWIVAVQSWWRRNQRITFGCPVKVFASIVEACLVEDDVRCFD